MEVIPCRSMDEGVVYVVSVVRSLCVESQTLRLRLGRGVDCARDRSSSEAQIALETGARARRRLRSRPGLGRVVDCAQNQGAGESLIPSEIRAWASRGSCFVRLGQEEVGLVNLKASFYSFFLLIRYPGI